MCHVPLLQEMAHSERGLDKALVVPVVCNAPAEAIPNMQSGLLIKVHKFGGVELAVLQRFEDSERSR